VRTASAAFAGVLAVVAVATTQCTNHDYYGQANVSQVEGDPRAQLDVNDGVFVPEGSVASAHIDLVGVGGTAYAGDVVSMNPNVLGIFHTPGDPGKYVFLGTSSSALGYEGKPGQAEVVISIDGVVVRSTMAVVEPPAAEDAGTDAGVDAEAGDGSGGDAQDAGDAGDATDAADAG
jgi:hypothetical protein